MKAVIIAKSFVIQLEMSENMALDILPLLRQGGKSEKWTLQQQQTFNSVAGCMEETLKAATFIKVGG